MAWHDRTILFRRGDWIYTTYGVVVGCHWVRRWRGWVVSSSDAAGGPTNSRLGICYTSPDAKVVRHAHHLSGTKIHPAQLYASLAHTALFVGFLILLPHKPFEGAIAGAYLIAHPILRVTLERFRSDDHGKLLGALTHTNAYSAIQVALGVALMVTLWGNGAPSPLDHGVHLGVVYAHGGATVALFVISLAVATAFGLHYREVGAWIPHDHAAQRTISLQRLQGAPSWRS